MPLRPSGLQPEGSIYIGDVVAGDRFSFSLRAQLVLEKSLVKENGRYVSTWVVENRPVTKRGTWATHGTGTVAANSDTDQIISINVGPSYRPGEKSAATNWKAQIQLGYGSIQKATVSRPRYVGVAPNQTISKFSRLIPVAFTAV
jgi:hypothetical protein